MSTQAQTQTQNPRTATTGTLAERLRENDQLNQAIDQVRKAIRANPETAAVWCLGIGFVLGWKLKPW